MWTISDEQMAAITESLVDVANQVVEGSAAQTTDPILPCKQVEVVSISCSEPTPLQQKEILCAQWLTDENVEIISSLTERDVKIHIETNGFPDGEMLNIKILDHKNRTVKSLKLPINGNKATSDSFNVEDEWLGKTLFINFEL